MGRSEAEKQLSLSLLSARSRASSEWVPGENEIEPFLRSDKVSREDQLALITSVMLRARLHAALSRRSERQLPHASLARYYRQHTLAYRVSERRDIRAIMNWNLAKVLQAKHEMQAHVPFKQIEERFNQSIEGGLRLGRGKGAGEKRYERDYFSAPPHVLIGPHKELLYYVFEVISIHPAHERPLAEVEPQIRHLLAERSVKLLESDSTSMLRKRTTCQTGQFAALCGRYANLGTTIL